MAKMTLIDIVQDIMSDANMDDVNNIQDTPDSLQVAQIIKSTYFEMIGNKNWPHLRELLSLASSTDSAMPTHMKLPDDVKEMEWIKYNTRKLADTFDRYSDLEYVYPDEFLTRTNAYKTDQANVTQITDFSGVRFNIITDKAPEFWTSFDDEFVVFNSYDSDVEAILQSIKTQASGFREPAWQHVDTFVPDLPSEAFPALLAEAKSSVFLRLKQMPDRKAEQQSTRQRNWLSRKAWRVNGGIKFPNYGRVTRK
jgi:hypothetical protein